MTEVTWPWLLLCVPFLVFPGLLLARALLRGNREEQRDDILVPPCGPMPAITDIPRTNKAPGLHADLIFGERRDTLPSPPMFSTTIRDGRDMPPIEINPAHVVHVTSAEQWRELVGYSSPEFEEAIRKASKLPPVKLHAVGLTAEPTPPPKLNPNLPPLDFGELPDVTDDAVESAAWSLSERPKGDV